VAGGHGGEIKPTAASIWWGAAAAAAGSAQLSLSCL